MKLFLLKILFFLIGLLAVFEIALRVNHMTIDIPQREITKDGIQRYIPNQKGWWIGGTHQWQINKMGWPGPMPISFDSLILIIGDSHIENFMNSDDCHQSTLLKQELPNFNFLEASRSGVSFIEAVKIASKLDTLNPLLKLIYVKDSDFLESISQLGRKSDITQIDLQSKQLLLGEMKSPGLKKILYNVKIAYYTFNKMQNAISGLKNKNNIPKNIIDSSVKSIPQGQIKLIEELLIYTQKQYSTDRKILIFHPGSDNRIIETAKLIGFKTIVFPEKYKKVWGISATDVSHWTCEGHKLAAEIVANEIQIIQDFGNFHNNNYLLQN